MSGDDASASAGEGRPADGTAPGAPAVPEGEPADARVFRPLDPRVVNLWRVQRLLPFGVLLLLMLGPVGFGVVAVDADWLRALIGGAWFVLLAVALFYVVVHPILLYRATGFRIDERVIEIKSGVLFRSLRLVPLSRLQHVDLQTDPMERMFGLSTLVLHTAGTHSARVGIDGLDAEEALRLRDRFVVLGEEDGV